MLRALYTVAIVANFAQHFVKRCAVIVLQNWKKPLQHFVAFNMLQQVAAIRSTLADPSQANVLLKTRITTSPGRRMKEMSFVHVRF